LNAAQTTKLKHLSIVTLASHRRILPYTSLLRSLDMPTVRELEDLIIDAIYLDVLRGRLDQKQAQLEVEYTMGRDLAPGAVEAVLAALQNWCVASSFSSTQPSPHASRTNANDSTGPQLPPPSSPRWTPSSRPSRPNPPRDATTSPHTTWRCRLHSPPLPRTRARAGAAGPWGSA
jgi:hypothetical protein